ncbi:patatin-like protein [Pseudemcibacter aquimaris]|uniref:patatin-like protein n=1 Tax=Pseudemcibacter aquimaris TaxID=2857064 RepID=UPI002010FAEB|nr:patatin-like protein [Pseudemcibacter aquimaris]MCC3861846.1 patatin-like protein [Pseudemcibacter aquimaris]WDU58599.1 patatin-like protein [Pseudemcibacter aquimaris]
MREKELRLALVCFGGVSLAIYMHGVSKEILKLARASKAIHASPDPLHSSRKTYAYPNDNVTDIPDTELVYFEILKGFAPELDIRVIIDTIAGASAGGMNSVFLARAIAHDLNFDHLRHHWLIEADVSKLTENKKKAGRWDRLVTKPLINLLSGKFLGNGNLSKQVKEKLPALLNIWDLKPPFDGKHLVGLVYGGLKGMGKVNFQSLLPRGHELDLFVTLTDFYGYKRSMLLNDPPIISELEHRHNLKFSYLKTAADKSLSKFKSDFDDDGLASLSFAARATSCFPGAFPPAQIRETEHFFKEQGSSWLNKDDFIKNNFKEYQSAGLDPEMTSFLDGSILNNKPFDQALNAIHDRPAFREVSRRVIYVDPNPERLKIKPNGAPPTMLNTLKGALSDIPMNEPMHDDLEEIHIHNQEVSTIKSVVDSVRPSVEKLVFEISPKKISTSTTFKDLESWRNIASARAVTEAGYSYEAYARLKIRSTVADLTKIISSLCNIAPRSKEKRIVFSAIQCWVMKNTQGESLLYGAEEKKGLFNWTKSFIKKDQSFENIPEWTKFIIDFDVNYQKRRLHFLIQELNSQYSINPDHVHELDAAKMALYHILENIKPTSIESRFDEDTLSTLIETVEKIKSLDINDDLDCAENMKQIRSISPDIEQLLDILNTNINLDNVRLETDQLISSQLNNSWDDGFKRKLLTNYLGFAFWDVITFSINGSKSVGEFNEILVNRISPNDDLVLKSDALEMPLKGTAMKSFGAFFSREDRENDYLWGRLNGAERLIDLLYHQAEQEGISEKFNIMNMKKRAFRAILEAEKEHLHEIPDLFNELQKRIDAL